MTVIDDLQTKLAPSGAQLVADDPHVGGVSNDLRPLRDAFMREGRDAHQSRHVCDELGQLCDVSAVAGKDLVDDDREAG